MQHRMFENSHYRNDAEGIGGDADIYMGVGWGTEAHNEVCVMVVFEPDILNISICNKRCWLSKLVTSKLLRSDFNFFLMFN